MLDYLVTIPVPWLKDGWLELVDLLWSRKHNGLMRSLNAMAESK
jgi:hypothetical protein